MGAAASVVSNLAATFTSVVTVSNEAAKREEEVEERDPRRRNSLAFYVSQFVNFEGEDFAKVIEAVKADKYSKTGGKPPNIRNSSKSETSK